MSLALITQPTFLRKRFWFTRQGLLGQWPEKGLVTTKPIQLPEIEEVSAQAPPQHWPTLPVERLPRENFVDQIVYQAPVQVLATSDLITETRAAIKPPDLDRTATKTITDRASWWKPATKFVLTLIMFISLALGALIIVPEVYYSLLSETASVNEVANAAKQSAQVQPAKTAEPEPYRPPKNPDLPTGTWVSIPRIGVYSEAQATENPDQALDTGVWMVPDFGRPGDYSQPTILAAHRYGWDWWWKTDYWKYNSFYLLTETEPGDTVEIIYDQRKWVYEIYDSEEGELISDYDADLILYTCKFLKSPIRYFRYAKLVIPQVTN